MRLVVVAFVFLLAGVVQAGKSRPQVVLNQHSTAPGASAGVPHFDAPYTGDPRPPPHRLLLRLPEPLPWQPLLDPLRTRSRSRRLGAPHPSSYIFRTIRTLIPRTGFCQSGEADAPCFRYCPNSGCRRSLACSSRTFTRRSHTSIRTTRNPG